ncbi:MAG TPA: ABC transporter permease [Stellaceae bacterium]|nr:ABC transporter permease [Stellaceae bacterium]
MTIAIAPSTRSVPLAWRNLLSNKRRLARAVAGIGFAVLLMLVQLGFKQGFFDASLGVVRQLDGAIIVMHATKYRFGSEDPFPRADLAKAPNVAGVASVTPLYASWLHFFWKSPADGKSYLVQVFAFDPDDPPFLLPAVRADSARLKAPDAVIVDRLARPFLGMASGARATELNGHPVQIVGSFALGPDFMSDGTVMMSAASYARLLTDNRASAASLPIEFGVIKLRPGSDVGAVERGLRAALPAGVRILSKRQLEEFETDFQANLSSAGPIFWMGALVGFIVGMLISYQVIYTDLADQLPQYATLKGMGYNTFYLLRVVFAQAALSAAAAYVPAWLLCLVVYRVIGDVALLPLHMTAMQTLISFALTLGMCLLSAAFAIRRVVALDPAEVF